MKNPVRPSSCVTPAGMSNELDVQNRWEENTHIVYCMYILYVVQKSVLVGYCCFHLTSYQ